MAIVIRKAFKKFPGSGTVIENLDLTVNAGTIYSLLGSSGCGKTTIFSCICGLRAFDEGSLLVFGKVPYEKGSQIPGRNIGYMPQEASSSLYTPFTIAEILNYYGKIYGMTPAEIQSRTDFLATSLHLPAITNKLINLSGGEVRRVSLAVAIIHQPKLLILDEPTVGIDPLIRQEIWEHLINLSRMGTTICISTQYIDEAKFTDTIGYLRNGRLSFEGNPKSLMDKYGSNSLEVAVLRMCHNDEENNDESFSILTPNESRLSKEIETLQYSYSSGMPDPEDDDLNKDGTIKLHQFRRMSSTTYLGNDEERRKSTTGSEESLTKCFSMDIIGAVVWKNFVIQFHHPMQVSFHLKEKESLYFLIRIMDESGLLVCYTMILLLFPTLQIILGQIITGRDPIGKTIVYTTSPSINLGNGTNFCQTVENGTCLNDELTTICSFFNLFESGEISWKQNFEGRNASLKMIEQGDAIAYLEFPTNFTDNFRNRLFFGKFSDDLMIDGSTLNVRMDVSESLSAAWIANKILTKVISFQKQTVEDCGGDPRALDFMKFHSFSGNVEGISWTQYFACGLIVVLTIALTGIPGCCWLMEKRMGIHDRSITAGVSFLHIICANLLSESLIIGGQIILYLIVFLNFFEMPMEGSLALSFCLMFLAALSGTAIGFFFASMAKTELQLVIILMFFNSFIITSSGATYPLQTTPLPFRYLYYLFPGSLPILGLRAVMFRGLGISSPVVQRGLISSFLWISIPLILSLFLNRSGRRR